MKANNRFEVADVQLHDNGLMIVKCAFLAGRAKDRLTTEPKLVFRCPMCGNVHEVSHRMLEIPAPCRMEAWKPFTCRKKALDLLVCAAMCQNKEKFGHFLLEPTDSFGQIGFLNRPLRERLITMEQAQGVFKRVEDLRKRRAEALDQINEFKQAYRLLAALEEDDTDKIMEVMNDVNGVNNA